MTTMSPDVSWESPAPGAFTRQLGGKLTASGPPGTTITLEFDLEPKPAEPIEPSGAENAA